MQLSHVLASTISLSQEKDNHLLYKADKDKTIVIWVPTYQDVAQLRGYIVKILTQLN